MEIGSLISLCKTALNGVSSLVKQYRRQKLSHEQKELLLAASKDGEFAILSADGVPWIRAGGKDFVDDNDPAFAATYLEAFRSLCQRGYISHQGNILFMLTGSGFKKAKELTSRLSH